MCTTLTVYSHWLTPDRDGDWRRDRYYAEHFTLHRDQDRDRDRENVVYMS